MVAGALAPRDSSLPPVAIKSNGGSSDAADPIANRDTCTRDIEECTKLGINTLRLYTIDNSANHDACMQALAAARIYLALDVKTPKYSINQIEPADSYNHVYLQENFATIDEFFKHDNLLMSDDNRVETAEYMNCGTDDERVDFFAFNDYSWRPTSLHWLWNGIYAREVFGTTWKTILDNAIDLYSGKARMTASKATRAIAFAGNALMKQGRKPLQNPFTPSFRHTFWAASLHRGNFVTPSPRPFPIGSVMMRCLTTSDG
ncbi:1,3-beta-glucanosyltransferase gel1 [Physcia stellaris]|nr:1,3-beta-glucanosyltransferase gel1 [Physcia stellaris]